MKSLPFSWKLLWPCTTTGIVNLKRSIIYFISENQGIGLVTYLLVYIFACVKNPKSYSVTSVHTYVDLAYQNVGILTYRNGTSI
jgi:hypothetical protein